MNFIIVHNVFLLLVIYCCNKASNRIVTKSKELVFYSWIPLSPEVSRLSPYTHARQHTQTLRSFCIFAVHRLHTSRKITLHIHISHMPPQSSNRAEPTLALKPRGDVTRSLETGVSVAPKMDVCPTEILKTKTTKNKNKNIHT